MKLTQKIFKQSFYMGMIVLLPTYLLFGSFIISALFQLIMNSFHLSLESANINACFNFFFDLILTVFAIVVFKNEFVIQFKNFKKSNKTEFINNVVLGIPVLYGASIIGNVLSMILTGDISSSENQIMVEEMIKQMPILMIITVTVLAPILEETVFRLLLFTGFYERGRWFAYLLSAGLFGLLHVYQPMLEGNFLEILKIFPYLFMGIGLCYIYERSDNILAPIFCHGIINGISVMIMIFM